jgi:single-stranded-DNA-specific exonuclease
LYKASKGEKLLNKHKTFKNYHWVLQEPETKDCLNLVQKLNIKELIARVLINRGIDSVDTAQDFLEPKLKNLLPDPTLLNDMDKAVTRIIQAIEKNENILIFADYDVDGATSAALLTRYLRQFDCNIKIYVPCRFKEGYGPNLEAFKRFVEEGYDLIITLDCGTVSFDPIGFLEDTKTDAIVIDHHLSLAELPKAVAVINPNRLDQEFPSKNIAAVAVAFLVLVAVNQAIKKLGAKYETVDLMQFLDLVALGTVCDVMPLQGINRAFVKQGLKVIEKRANLGLTVLADLVELEGRITTYHLGYLIGPRINAGGRIGEGFLGANLLTTSDMKEAHEIAAALSKYNEQRRAIEHIIVEEAIQMVEMNDLLERKVIIVAGKDWNAGVIGIIASRLKDKYQKPVIVLSLVDGIGKGSARSIVGIDIGLCFSLAVKEGLLIDGGGHVMAGGCTIPEKNLPKFYDFVDNFVRKLGDLEDAYENAVKLSVDGCIGVSGANIELLQELKTLEPVGQANPRPRFHIENCIIVKAWVAAQKHIIFLVKDGNLGADAKILKCVLFQAIPSHQADLIIQKKRRRISLVGYLQINKFDNSKIDFIVEDCCLNNE